MGRLYQPLLFLLARCTRNELIRQIEWLKAENEMLRKRVGKKRIFLDLPVSKGFRAPSRRCFSASG